MSLQKLLDAVEHNNNLQNNYNVGFYWFEKQRYKKAKEWADKAIKHKSKSNPRDINILNYLIVKTLYFKAGDDIAILKSALPFIEEIKKFEGDKYMNMSEGLGTNVERKIAELEKGGNTDLMSFA